MKKRTAIYPGTFDPITLGHLDVIKATSQIFDEVIIAILPNVRKHPYFKLETRLTMIKESLKDYKIRNAWVMDFKGLTVDLAKEKGAITMVRGLRLVMDFEAELDICFNNKVLSPGIITIFLPPNQDHIHIRSSTVREFLQFGLINQGVLKQYVPAAVLKYLK